MKKQILAMGGGGFSMEPENLKLDKYLLSLLEKPNPKVCFIGTTLRHSRRTSLTDKARPAPTMMVYVRKAGVDIRGASDFLDLHDPNREASQVLEFP